MNNEILKILFTCLILTVIFEITAALIIGIKEKKDLLNIILVNIITNPLVNTITFYMNLKYGVGARKITLVIMELFALLFEGYIYKKYLKYKKINPFLISLILNGLSYILGVIINGF